MPLWSTKYIPIVLFPFAPPLFRPMRTQPTVAKVRCRLKRKSLRRGSKFAKEDNLEIE
jgi:hypothetical protein